MKKTLRVGILGAGLGSRLQSRAKAKPLAPIAGKSLLQHLVSRFEAAGAEEITCALRDELLTEQDKAGLPQSARLHYLFVNTESSLHTLGALVETMGTSRGPALFSMADTVLYPADLRAFLSCVENLAEGECAVLATTFVDDEKPLWVQTNESGYATKFSSEQGSCVTSGM